MTAASAPIRRLDSTSRRLVTVVWIDSREAIIGRWRDGAADVERIESDIPAHHGATGHVRHDPTIRHGGGGPPQTAGEPHRLEHLTRFLVTVVGRLPERDDLLLMGPGTVHEELGRHLHEADVRKGLARHVHCEAASRISRGQLVARLREAAGDAAARRTVGAYRWSSGQLKKRSGKRGLVPRRVAEKRTIHRLGSAQEG